MACFGPIAPHYDILMAKVPYRMWTSYYQLLLAKIDAKPSRLLDVCCGTGTAAELLAADGYIVEGFDISPQMIAEARRKADEKGFNIRYEIADAATFEMGKRYEGAYSFFDSLNYIVELPNLREAISRVGRHLLPGASFVFDVNTASAFEDHLFDQHETRRQAEIRYNWSGEYDRATRTIQVFMEFWRGDEKFTETHLQKAHSDEEIRVCLENAGFIDVRAFDSYTLNPPRKKSDRVHYVAVLR